MGFLQFAAVLGQGYLFSQPFKPITTAHRQATMKEIACTIGRVERRVCVSIVNRPGVRIIKTIETREGGSLGV